MAATRRTFGRLTARKIRRDPAPSFGETAPAKPAYVDAAKQPIDPVSADPAVVLWDEVAVPEGAHIEPEVRGAARPDKSLS